MSRIVIASHEFPPRIGGAGVVAKDLAISLAQCGHDVTIITHYSSGLLNVLTKRCLVDYLGTCRIIKIPVFRNTWFFSYPYILKGLIPADTDILIFNDVAISYLYKHTGLSKVVHYLHGKESYFKYAGFIRSKVLRFEHVFRRNFDMADHVVCVSDFIASWLKKQAVVKAESKIKVLKNRIDSSLFVYSDSIPEEYRISMSGDVLVSASRLVEGKGYRRMLRIFSELVIDDKCDLNWIVVGDGDYRKELEEEVSRLGLCDRITFMGRVDRADLVYLYSQADLFWLLSDYEEAFPLVYKEAIACGLPAIGNNKGGVKEVISHGDDGFLCDNDADVKSVILNRKFSRLVIPHSTAGFEGAAFGKEFLAAVVDGAK